MNEKEFKIFCATLKSVYTQTNFLPDHYAMDIWFKMLSDLNYDVVSAAISNYMQTERYPPTIADIRHRCSLITHEPIPNWDQAWGNVLMAIRNFGYPRELDALNSLTEITRKIVKRMGWQNICSSQNIMTDRANFRDAYKVEADQQLLNNKLSLSVKNEERKILDHYVNNLATKLSFDKFLDKIDHEEKYISYDNWRELRKEIQNENQNIGG